MQSFDPVERVFTLDYQQENILPLDLDFDMESRDIKLSIIGQFGRSRIVRGTAEVTLRVINPCSDLSSLAQKPLWCPVKKVNFYIPNMPNWQASLTDIFINTTRTEPVLIDLGPRLNQFNMSTLNVTVNIGEAGGFALYDKEHNAIIIDAERLGQKDLGYYKVSVISTEIINDVTYSYSKQIYLIVVDGNPNSPVVPEPDLPI